ncbi:ketopantoate reductase family protein [Ectobacillus panaciterrae]|uniref:ketopantoate reductase family protein n=1 Tax=Ectobacillus panaciterrae TaxID=363872 RepID=UPI0004248C09|nr:ketopantoate reductase family protein [Ectobacillus panaciterrae]
MKFLVVGAGAVGGYFGARLAEKGEDVTFLVRAGRQEQLRAKGLVVKSVNGDTTIRPKTILSNENGLFDVILIGTKAYHFEQAIQDIKPFVHSETVIIPMLNGMKHVEHLREVFPEQCVIGGLCFIESTLSENGEVIQTSPFHKFMFGEWDGEKIGRIQAIEQAFTDTNAMISVSSRILQEMWHKYLFIATFSGVTTLFGQPIGPILELPLGSKLVQELLREIASIMRAEGAPIADNIEEKQFASIGAMAYEMKSSMQRDMEKGLFVEGDHLQGYLLELGNKHNIQTPVLETIYANLKLYEKKVKSETMYIQGNKRTVF